MFFKEWSTVEGMVYATLFFMGRYIVIAGLFYLIFYTLWKNRFKTYKIQRKWPKLKQLRAEIGYSLLTFTIYGGAVWLFLYWIANGTTQRYETIADFGLPYFVISVGIMVVLHDTYFYWTHRLMHHPRWFKWMHRTHHRFHAPTPWAAFAFHPLETVVSLGIIPIIIFGIPYHPWALMCFITLMTLYNISIHLGYQLPGMWWTSIQNTADDHDLHHSSGQGNYGLYFTLWDRWLGTYRPVTKQTNLHPYSNKKELQ